MAKRGAKLVPDSEADILSSSRQTGVEAQERAGRTGALPSSSSAAADDASAREALRALDPWYRALVLATGQITWTARQHGSTGGWTGDDRDWRLITGQETGTAGMWSQLEAQHPDDRERISAAWNEAVATQVTLEIDCGVCCYDGEYRWFLARGVPVLAADGSVHERVGTATDITERKQAEAAARERGARTPTF